MAAAATMLVTLVLRDAAVNGAGADGGWCGRRGRCGRNSVDDSGGRGGGDGSAVVLAHHTKEVPYCAVLSHHHKCNSMVVAESLLPFKNHPENIALPRGETIAETCMASVSM